ncbi:MAG: ral secretion pathway protein [Gemmatimonadales bacterium]|nr:ral secretion pathway protein [Gemmatimonadales bacterium]
MRAGCRIIALLLGFAAASPALAQAQETVRINYVDADLRDVIRSLATVLGVNVVLTDVPSKRITFQTPEPVAVAQVGAVLEAILESQGLAMVEAGPVSQVMPDAKRPSTGPIRVGKELQKPPPLGIITQIVPLDYIGAEEAVAFLTQIASKAARIELVPRSNAILITDRGVNIARYLELLQQLDVKTGGESGLRTYVYPLKHASAVELSGTLSQVFGGTGAGPTDRTRVQALENRSLSSDLDSFRKREMEALEQRRQTPVPTLAPPPATASPRAEAGSGGGQPGLVGQTTIVPDQATNSLVVRTAPPNFPVLQETIDRLDVRPAQVLLEVLIAEVSLGNATQYGINWRLFTQELVTGDSTRGITGLVGGPNFGDSALGSLGGLGLRVVSMGASVDVRAIIQALASRTNVKVLSTPRILALNNEEARILVGSEVPFTQSTRTGLDVVVDQTVQFRNVGTQLTIVPTVNKDRYVTFRILQEVSSLTAQTIQAALNAPVISTREVETSAIVRSGSTIIIGGLIGESEQLIQSGVPILQDIPILGALFRNRGKSQSRSELAIFVTPHVVLDDAQADSLLRQQRGQLRSMQPVIDSIFPQVREDGKNSVTGEKAMTGR